MKKTYLLLIFSLLFFTNLFAQSNKAIIELKDGIILKDEIDLGLKKGKTSIKTKSNGYIKCENVERVFISDDFSKRGSAVELVPLQRSKKKYCWGIPFIQGKVNLYEYIFQDNTLKIKKKEEKYKITYKGGPGTTFVITKNDYVVKGFSPPIPVTGRGMAYTPYRKILKQMFSNCPKVSNEITTKDIRKVVDLIEYYNKGCK